MFYDTFMVPICKNKCNVEKFNPSLCTKYFCRDPAGADPHPAVGVRRHGDRVRHLPQQGGGHGQAGRLRQQLQKRFPAQQSVGPEQY